MVSQIRLRWTSHQPTLVSVLETLLVAESFVDVTLAAEGQFIKAHKVILSACSPYFQDLLNAQKEEKVIVFLKDVKFSELKALISYIYRGEVNISQEELPSLLKVAESLQIRGLADIDQRPSETNIGPIQPNIQNESTKVTAGNSANPPFLVPSIPPESCGNNEKRGNDRSGGNERNCIKKIKLEPSEEKRIFRPEEEEEISPDPLAILPNEVKTHEDSPPFLEDEEEYGDEMPNLPHEADFNDDSAGEFVGGWAMEESNSDPGVFDNEANEGVTLKVHQCEVCSRIYKRPSCLVRHRKYECNRQPQFSCTFCGILMKLKTNIKAHERRCRLKPTSKFKVTKNGV